MSFKATGKKKREVHICLRRIQRENAPLLVDKPIEVINGFRLGFRGCLRVFLR